MEGKQRLQLLHRLVAARALRESIERRADRADAREVETARAFGAIRSDIYPGGKAREDVVVGGHVAERSIGCAFVENLVGDGHRVADRLRTRRNLEVSGDARRWIRNCHGVRRVEVHHVDENAAFESGVLVEGEVIIDDVRAGQV